MPAALALCLCALAAAAAAADSTATATATVTAAPTVRLHVAFSPDRAGARTTIELALHVLGGSGGPPPALRSMALRLPAGMGIATTTLGEANCAPGELIAAGLSRCSSNALLGFGSATAVVPFGASKVIERASLHPLMGPPHEPGGSPLLRAGKHSRVRPTGVAGSARRRRRSFWRTAADLGATGRSLAGRA